MSTPVKQQHNVPVVTTRWFNTSPAWYLRRDLDEHCEADIRRFAWLDREGPFVAVTSWVRGSRCLDLRISYNDNTDPQRAPRLTSEMVRQAVQSARWNYPILSKRGIETGGDPQQVTRARLIPWDEWLAAFTDVGFVVRDVVVTPFASSYHVLYLESSRLPIAVPPILHQK